MLPKQSLQIAVQEHENCLTVLRFTLYPMSFYQQTSPGQQDTTHERAAWVRERLAARNALDEAEDQIAQLKAEVEAMHREAAGGPRGLANGDVVDMQTHKVCCCIIVQGCNFILFWEIQNQFQLTLLIT